LVGADLEVMDRDAKKMREERPFLFTDLKTHKGLDDVVAWLTKEFLF
jgi:urease accessory protein